MERTLPPFPPKNAWEPYRWIESKDGGLSENAMKFYLSPGERAGVRASVNSHLSKAFLRTA